MLIIAVTAMIVVGVGKRKYHIRFRDMRVMHCIADALYVMCVWTVISLLSVVRRILCSQNESPLFVWTEKRPIN